VEVFQLEVGISGQVFEVLALLALAIMDSWIKECWLDMVKNDIHIILDIPDLEAPWVGDEEIMCAVLWAGFQT